MLPINYHCIGDEEDLKVWIIQSAEKNLMPLPDFAHLVLHRNAHMDNLCNLHMAHDFITEYNQGLSAKTPSLRELLMKHTPTIVNGLFASPYYTALMTDHLLNDIDLTPFGKAFPNRMPIYCPLCAKEDDEEIMSVPHLHSERPSCRVRVPHQIEGITACYKHGVSLSTDPHAEVVRADEGEVRMARTIYALYKAGCVGSVDDLMISLNERMKEKGIKDRFTRSFGPSVSVISAAAQVFEPEELIEIYRRNEDNLIENALEKIRIKHPEAEIISHDFPLMTFRCGCGHDHTVYIGSALLGAQCPTDMKSDEWRNILLYRSRFCMDPRFELTGIDDDVTGTIRHMDCGYSFPMKIRRVMGGYGFTCPACAKQRLMDLVGKEHVMNCGLKAIIIAARSVVDIDVSFEDGRIRTGVTYQNFLDGSIIPYRYYQDNHLDETRIMNCGLKATIIRYENQFDMDVRFENGMVKTGVTYADFKAGRLQPKGYRQLKAAEKVVGKWSMMKCGLKARIIERRSHIDCDVEFEDGSIRKGVRPYHFMNGSISPEGFYLPKPGEERVMSNGLKAKIIAVRSYVDIDVQFENGEIRTGIQYAAFCAGYVKSEIFEKQRKDGHKGEVYRQNCGLDAEIIEYSNATHCTVRFSNGEERENVIYSKLKLGSVLPPSFKNKNRIEEKHMQRCGMEAEIIADRGATDLDVRFENGMMREHVTYYDVTHGRVKPVKRSDIWKERVGETFLQKCGLKARIIDARNARDVDIEFENDEVREHVVYANVKSGSVVPPSMMRIKK